MCFNTYLNHPINQKKHCVKKKPMAITVLKKEGGGLARYGHDHSFNGSFFYAFSNVILEMYVKVTLRLNSLEYPNLEFINFLFQVGSTDLNGCFYSHRLLWPGEAIPGENLLRFGHCKIECMFVWLSQYYRELAGLLMLLPVKPALGFYCHAV